MTSAAESCEDFLSGRISPCKVMELEFDICTVILDTNCRSALFSPAALPFAASTLSQKKKIIIIDFRQGQDTKIKIHAAS